MLILMVMLDGIGKTSFQTVQLRFVGSYNAFSFIHRADHRAQPKCRSDLVWVGDMLIHEVI